MPESVTVGELLVRLKADMSQLDTGLRNGQQAVQGFANRTRPGLRGVETALRLVGLRAAGITGPVGTLSRTLLAFAPGGLVTAGVIGGVGLIALAFKALGDRAKRAREEMEKARKLMHDLATPRIEFFQGLNELIAQATGMGAGEDQPFFDILDQLTRAQEQLQQRLDEAAPLGKLFGIFPDTAQVRALRGYLDQLATAINNVHDAWERAGRGVMGRQDALEGLVPMVLGQERPHLMDVGLKTGLFGGLQDVGRDIGDIIANDENIQRIVRAFEKQRAAFEAIGQSIGFALQDGILSVLRGGNFFKAFGLTLLNIGIAVATRGIGNAITGALTSSAGGTSTSKVAGVGIQSAIDFSNFPAASNPLASARDKDWQRFFRESGLVAASQGFRG